MGPQFRDQGTRMQQPAMSSGHHQQQQQRQQQHQQHQQQQHQQQYRSEQPSSRMAPVPPPSPMSQHPRNPAQGSYSQSNARTNTALHSNAPTEMNGHAPMNNATNNMRRGSGSGRNSNARTYPRLPFQRKASTSRVHHNPQNPPSMINSGHGMRGSQHTATGASIVSSSTPPRASRLNSATNFDRFDHEELSIVASDEGSSSHDSESAGYRSDGHSVHGSRFLGFFFPSRRHRRSGKYGRRHKRGDKQEDRDNEVVMKLVRKEIAIVDKLRYVVVAVLILVPIVFAVLMWDLARDKDELRDDINAASAGTTNNGDATTSPLWLDSFAHSFQHLWTEQNQNILSSLFTVSAMYTSASLDATQTSPNDGNSGITNDDGAFVTLDNLEAIVTGIYQTLAPQYVIFAPLIFNVPTAIEQYTNYAVTQQQQTCSLIGCQVVTEITTPPGGDDDSFLLNPVWQIVPPFIGNNANSTFVLQNQMNQDIQTVVSNKIGYWSSFDISRAAANANEQQQPTTTTYYPVFETFQQNDMIGIVSLVFSIERLLQTAVALPDNDDNANPDLDATAPIISLNVQFQCSNASATAGAEADIHQYDVFVNGTVQYAGGNQDARKSINQNWDRTLTIPTAFAYSEFEKPFAGADGAVCPLTVRIVPLQNLEQETTAIESVDDPAVQETIIYPIIAGIAMCILISAFAVYDWYVEKRQSVVVNVATKFSAVVSNLFPEQVRDRMLQNVGDNKNKKGDHAGASAGSSLPILNNTSTSGGMGGSGNGANGNGTGLGGTGSSKSSALNAAGSSSKKALGNGSADQNNGDGSANGDGANGSGKNGNGKNGKPSGGRSKTKNGGPRSKKRLNGAPGGGSVSIKQFLSMPETSTDLSSEPIADFFQNTTVLFADIAGFTAWSSQREPAQVFTLLETLYRSFDVIAAKLKVFKVETIGDCYMAVTGLPNPDTHHAVHMSRFAYQSLLGMQELIKELEAHLGPGTSDLALRVGLHSGPVTAGVLRGEKSRFQLFGDTVNTASRMESTGERGRIQISQETADLLIAAGKNHWLKPRDKLVVAKGKGELKTFWLDPTKKRRATKTTKEIRVTTDINVHNNLVDRSGGSNANGAIEAPAKIPGVAASPHRPMGGSMHVGRNSSSSGNMTDDPGFDEKYARLIDWNVELLLFHLARVISFRSRSPSRGSMVNHSAEVALLPSAVNDVAEVVALPPFDAEASKYRRERPDTSMMNQTRSDLRDYVRLIAAMYRENPFHSFEHASHVTLCANKMLNRLITSDEYEKEEELHNATFGISSDPLTHFAIVFAAIIHDVDHTGLPNAQLVKDQHELAVKFENKSVAEQNSVHIGWELLMDPRFERLRKCIYQTNVERKRFRQLVINCIMATDIASREVNQTREQKWNKAFRRPTPVLGHVTATGQVTSAFQIQEDMNRKATAVIEHMIQVSDVAHTMQHWHIYRRWNERLFHEMHNAYEAGLAAVHPAENWYRGELGFFDYYLLPLAKKLLDCGTFGASGHEYISYVMKNKREWEHKGPKVVEEMEVLYKDAVEDTEDESSYIDEDETDSELDSDDIGYDSPGDLTSSDEYDDRYDDYDGDYQGDYQGDYHDDAEGSMSESSEEDDDYDGEDEGEAASRERYDYDNYGGMPAPRPT